MNDWSEVHRAIFFPYAEAARARAVAEGLRFAYYTNADTALKILESKSIWLRNTALMNDFSEVEHGYECIRNALATKEGEILGESLGALWPNVLSNAWQDFKIRSDTALEQTYIACISEHDHNEREGRLSMWRAYGGNAGVAFVFKNTPLFSESDALGVYSSPVFYGRVADIRSQFLRIAEGVRTNHDLVAELGEQTVFEALRQVFLFGSVCTKHPAFKEEREWRVIASPGFFDVHLPAQIESIGGTPQRVYKLEFKDMANQGIDGLHLDALVDQVLIGPCDHPAVVAGALEDRMEAAGITNPGGRVVYTDIPLRPNPR